MAVPSMLMVLPSGMEKLETLREAPSFCTLVRFPTQELGVRTVLPVGGGEDLGVALAAEENDPLVKDAEALHRPKLGQGADACKALLKDNPELLDELEAKVREALAAKEQK